MNRVFYTSLLALMICVTAPQVAIAQDNSVAEQPALGLPAGTADAQDEIVVDAPMIAEDAPAPVQGALGVLPPAPSGDVSGSDFSGTDFSGGGGEEADFITRLTEEQEKNITDRAFPLDTAIWDDPEIFVCWEEMAEQFADQRAAVRAAVEGTWETASKLDFFGWQQCRDGVGGIRIAVKDIGPHVKSLGQFVDGKPEGMVLNFTYEIWSPGCQDQMDYCNRVIAVHEFGHAIGFAHEQNRPDTPGECDRVQGTMGDNVSLTPWDPESVMNYCNPLYGNGGVLSAFDIAAVQYIYGK